MGQPDQELVQHSPMTRGRVAELRVGCQQDPHSVSLHQEAVEEFLAAGLSAEALPLLRRLVALCPEDVGVVTRLGDALAERGEHREAIVRFRRATALTPDSPETYRRLGIAACTAGEYAVAREAFERQIDLAPDNFVTMNDLAVLYGLENRDDDAGRMYRRCLEIDPCYEKGRRNALQFFWETSRYEAGAELIEHLRQACGDDATLTQWHARFTDPKAATTGPWTSAGPRGSRGGNQGTRVTGRKIAFVGSSDVFLRPIIGHFSAGNEVRCAHPQASTDLAEIMRWADLTWLEWCDGLAIQGSQFRKTGKVVCRLHSYEAFTDFPTQVNWRNIDCLILVNRSVGEILDEAGCRTARRVVIPNGIYPERFPLAPRTQRGRKIGSVGYINYKKNPSLLLQTVKALHERDPAFELHIAGTHQDPRIKVYFDHLLPRLGIPVTFHGWIEDMPAFYAEMDYVISTSLFESFHYSIAEGMLSGCLPLVHSWKGADYLYPQHALFDTPAGAQAVIEHYDRCDTEQVVREHRAHIVNRFNWSDRLTEIDRLLYAVLTGDAAEIAEMGAGAQNVAVPCV